MIPEAAVEAAAWAIYASDTPSTTASRLSDLDRYTRNDVLRQARAALEAAAPYMLTGSAEFGVFRKGGDEHDAPMGNRTYARRDRAEANMRQFVAYDSWLEVRERTVTPWTVTREGAAHGND